MGSQDHRGLWTHRAYQVGAKRTGRRERGMGRAQGKLGDSGEGEREIPVSLSLLFPLSVPMCPSVHHYVFVPRLSSYPPNPTIFFISSFSDISPSGSIILTVSLPSVRQECREGSADFTNLLSVYSHIYNVCLYCRVTSNGPRRIQ